MLEDKRYVPPPVPCSNDVHPPKAPTLTRKKKKKRHRSGVEEIDAMVEEARVIHPTHYVVFWALETTAKRLSRESAGRGGGRRERKAAEAEVAWTRYTFFAVDPPT